jgi:ABC-2 type transport system permease protein
VTINTQATTAPATPPSTTTRSAHLSKLSFGGVLKSEFIKLFTLRSTCWCILILLVLSIGIGLIVATVSPPARAHVPAPVLTTAGQQSQAVADATIGTGFGELVFAVLGALVITGEYGTGMIRSTFAAVPKRLPALFAKAIVLGITTFIVGLATIYATALIIFPLLPGKHIHPNWGDWKLEEALIGGAVYLTLIALVAFSIGAIVRNSAGGIAAALGLILVLPGILELISGLTQATWAENLVVFAPTSAGGHLYDYVVTAPVAVSGVALLDRTTGGLVLIAWVVVLFVVAAVMLKRRDA